MTLLLLAGTSEARRIAWGLSDSATPVIASLAGATRRSEPMPVPTRVGGFGGEDGFRRFIKAKDITAVLDATHPFAEAISARTARVCADLGLPYAQVMRPVWEPDTGDQWSFVRGPDEVAPLIPDTGVVFLATGRQTLDRYTGLGNRRVLVRMIDPPTQVLPFDTWEFVIGRPPFSQEREEELFRALDVTHLVVKNAGGQGGRAKLDAARTLNIPVVLLERSPPLEVTTLTDVQKALHWVSHL